MDCSRRRTPGGGPLSGSGSKSLTLAGTLAQINAALGTLADLDSTTLSDSIALHAVDQFNVSSATQNLAVTVNSLPTISAPASDVVGIGQSAVLSGLGVNESGNTTGETLTVIVSDSQGLLTGNTSGGGAIANNGTDDITITGTFAQVEAILGALAIKEASGTSDTVTVTATDGFGNSATPASIAITIEQRAGRGGADDGDCGAECRYGGHGRQRFGDGNHSRRDLQRRRRRHIGRSRRDCHERKHGHVDNGGKKL